MTDKPEAFAVTVAIATTGRSAIIADTIGHLAGLADGPDRVVISIADPADFDRAVLPDLPFPLKVLQGPKGSCIQRNAVLDHAVAGALPAAPSTNEEASKTADDRVTAGAAGKAGLILFLDDDYLIAEGHVSALRRLFAAHDDVMMSTGRVLADGAQGPGLSHREGLKVLAAAPPTPGVPQPEDTHSVYGCNMALRESVLLAHPERFDEALPLYGWLEDMDLCRRMARHGRIVRDASLLGVHLGTKTAKSAGLFLGYSQIANPVHMIRKGSVQPAPVVKLMARNVLANLGKSVRPEPWIDRRGRLRGNLIALGDLLRGRCVPDRILTLK